MTSATAVGIVRRILQNEGHCTEGRRRVRVGHGGTLDRDASGVLVLGIGRAGCQRLTTELAGNKRYLVGGLLGTETDTLDTSGTVVRTRPHGHVTKLALEEVLAQFIPSYIQTAPLYSALKVRGQRMSDRVRRGETVDCKSRSVNIFRASCVSFHNPFFELDVSCGGGTYMRSLVRELGCRLDSCAHMVSLCRTEQGPFNAQHALLVRGEKK